MLEQCRISGFADEIDADIEKQIKLLIELKQSYIEFRSANKKGVADYSLEEAREIKKMLDRNGIKVSAIGSPIGKILITDDFTTHFEVFQHVVKIAKIFDTSYIRMFSFYIPKGENPDDYQKEVYHRLGRMIEYAKEQEVVLLHENEKDIYGDTDLRCFGLMSEFYGDHFKCTFDFANFVQCNVDTKKAYDMLKPYIHYVHVKDALSDTGEVVPPGHGDGQLAEILRDMDTSGYQGFLSMEPHLVDFAGLQGLEQEAKERLNTNGEAAYLLAYQEFLKLLH